MKIHVSKNSVCLTVCLRSNLLYVAVFNGQAVQAEQMFTHDMRHDAILSSLFWRYYSITTLIPSAKKR